MDFTLASPQLATTYPCISKFSRKNGNCENINKTVRFYSYQSSTFANVTKNQATLTLTQGYNLFTNNDLGFGNFIVRTGQLIFIQFLTGRVAVDISGATISDYVLLNMTSNHSKSNCHSKS